MDDLAKTTNDGARGVTPTMRTWWVAAIFAAMGLAWAEDGTPDWQKEAVKKYPELARAGSELNKRFSDAMTSARAERPQLFADPKWPMILADELDKPSVKLPGTSPAAPPTGMPAGPVSDPLLLGNKRVTTARELAEASAKKLEGAVQARNPGQIQTACLELIHENPVIRAQAKTLGQTAVDAAREVVAAEKFRKEADTEVARLRQNAAVAELPSALSPNDPWKQKQAAKLREQANTLGRKAETRLANAKQAFEECLEGVRALLGKARGGEEHE